jgi:hypothetical protein
MFPPPGRPLFTNLASQPPRPERQPLGVSIVAARLALSTRTVAISCTVLKVVAGHNPLSVADPRISFSLFPSQLSAPPPKFACKRRAKPPRLPPDLSRPLLANFPPAHTHRVREGKRENETGASPHNRKRIMTSNKQTRKQTVQEIATILVDTDPANLTPFTLTMETPSGSRSYNFTNLLQGVWLAKFVNKRIKILVEVVET